MSLKSNQLGDTIVEVMIAVAVIGLTLASSYAIVVSSLKSARQAQERGEALKLAEGQVEQLKALSTQLGPKIFVQNKIFCLNGSPDPVIIPGTTINPDPNIDDFTLYPPACVPNSSFYHVAIDVHPVNGNDYQFNVHVRWDSFDGKLGREEVIMRYRLAQ